MMRRLLLIGLLPLAMLGGCSRLSSDAPAGSEAACIICHALPPARGVHVKTFHQSFVRQCGLCHAGYDSVSVNEATHNNGTVDTATGLRAADPACKLCHGGGSGSGCRQCHGLPPDTLTHAVSAHQSFAVQCGLCHAGYDSATANAATHQNGAVDTATVQASDARCRACHAGANGGTGCRRCHALPPDTLTHAVAPHQVFVMRCGLCHAGYDSSSTNDSTHRNGALDTATVRSTDTTCTQCHGSGTGTGCRRCHGIPPQEGTHTVDKHAKFVVQCGLCHAGYDSSITVDSMHRNGVVDTATHRSTDPQCRMCHSGTGAGCASCHAFPPAGALHTTHRARNYDCSVCHPGNPSRSVPRASGAYHENDTVNVSVTYPFTIPPAPSAFSWVESTYTCRSVYCHGNFNGGTNSGTVREADSVSLTCGSCHGLPPTGDGVTEHSEQDHQSFVKDCGYCHPGYTATTVSAAMHINGRFNVTIPPRSTTLPCSGCH